METIRSLETTVNLFRTVWGDVLEGDILFQVS
jgi:hypothetical protein